MNKSLIWVSLALALAGAGAMADVPEAIENAGISLVVMAIGGMGVVASLVYKVMAGRVARTNDVHTKADIAAHNAHIQRQLATDHEHNKLIEAEYRRLSERYLEMNVKYASLFGWAKAQKGFPTWLDFGEPEESHTVVLTANDILELRPGKSVGKGT